jgi:cell wall-associated NlpC family hydrolase
VRKKRAALRRRIARRDRGATTIEYVALTVFAALIVAAVVAAPAIGTLGSYTTSAVNKILDTDDHVNTVGGLGSVDIAGAPNVKAAAALKLALQQVGKTYIWGATGPDAFDCSGLMLWAYNKVGVSIPRVSQDQFRLGKRVPGGPGALKPGDLVFFHTEGDNPGEATHVGMYMGNDQFVEAANPNDGVITSHLSTYPYPYLGATRPTG